VSTQVAVARPGFRRLALAYLELTKPRIVLLVLFTGLPALLMARGGFPGARVFWGALAGIALAAASGAAFNHYLDRDLDRRMRRTAQRPLPSGLVPPVHALGLGFLLAGFSWAALMSWANLLTAVLAQISIFYYAVVYTAWLKRRTPQNIVIGGAAGAAPALVGWAAVTGSVGLPAWILFAIVFVWTPPHFWALAMRYSGDYAAAGIPMLPVVRGAEETRKQILLYSLVLFGTSLVLVPVASMGAIYTATAVVLGGWFVWRALRLWRGTSPAESMRLFKFSILYLGLLFASVALDAVALG
jgi:protoheme IX farnesyltransferase